MIENPTRGDVILLVTSTRLRLDLHILNGFIPQKNDLFLGLNSCG